MVIEVAPAMGGQHRSQVAREGVPGRGVGLELSSEAIRMWVGLEAGAGCLGVEIAGIKALRSGQNESSSAEGQSGVSAFI